MFLALKRLNCFIENEKKVKIYEQKINLWIKKLLFIDIINVQAQSNLMLKTQKQRCRQPIIAQLLINQQRSSQSKPRNRQIIEQLAKKHKIIQTKSDNNHNRKTIADKKLKSLNLLPKQEVRINYDFDQYQIGTKNQYKEKQTQQQFTNDKYNQCLRDDTSSSNHGQILSHYRQSKSRYKNAKQKAKKLILKMLTSSKNNSEELQNQLIRKIDEVKSNLPIDKSPHQEYGMISTTLKKYNSTSGSTGFQPKIQKCSTLKLANREKSPLLNREYSGRISNRGFTNSQQSSRPSSASRIRLENNLQSRKSKISISKNDQVTVITNSDRTSTSSNPLVLQGKHLYTEYGIQDYGKPSTQKSIKQQTQNTSRQVSRQMPVTKRQTQKIIIRARHKNKKIIGKLKQMKQKRSAFRNSHYNKGDLNQSGTRFSKLGANFKSNLKNSILRSRLDQSRQKFMQSSGTNFLSLNSNIHSSSIITFNEQTRQKILIHLETIKTIADYAQSFTNIYEDCTQWEDLIFLLYKKYYVERLKIYNILKVGFTKFKDGSICKQSPFSFDFCPVTQQQLQAFRESKEQFSVELQIETSNLTIKDSLRDLYNKFIEKTSENSSINMYDLDDFSEQILQDLNEQINMLIESCGKSVKIKRRINEAIQVGLMIAHIEGYLFQQIEEIVFGQVQKRQYFDQYYPKFLQIFQQNQVQR